MESVSVTRAGFVADEVMVAEFSAALIWDCVPSSVSEVLPCVPDESVEPFSVTFSAPEVLESTARTVSPLV